MLTALVQTLFSGGRPSAITRAVALVVVNAIDQVFGRRSESHVGMEVLEGFKPALAHCYSAIEIVASVLGGTRASAFHVGPDMPFSGAGHGMSSIFKPSHFSFQATARARAGQIVLLDGFIRAAVASATHLWMLAARKQFKDRQPSVF